MKRFFGLIFKFYGYLNIISVVLGPFILVGTSLSGNTQKIGVETIVIMFLTVIVGFLWGKMWIKIGSSLDNSGRTKQHISKNKHDVQSQQQRKTVKSREYYFGKVLNFIGYLLLACFSVFLIGLLIISGDTDREGRLLVLIAVGFVFFMPGIILVRFGSRLTDKNSKSKSMYGHLIVDQGVISIIEMATLLKEDMKITRIDIENAKKEVQKLIDSKYLSDYYIDEKRLLVLKKSPPLQSQEHPYSRIKSRKKRNLIRY